MGINEIYLGILAVLVVTEILLLFVYTQRLHFPHKVDGRYSLRGVLVSVSMYTLIGVACTQFISLQIGHDLITPRELIMVFAGLVGGPVVALPTAALTATGTLFIGGHTAVASAISCFVCAGLGSLLWFSAKKQFPDTWACTALIIIAMVFNFGIIVLMSNGSPFNTISVTAVIIMTILNTATMLATAYLYNILIKDNEGL